jgi:hypothetical protein
MKNEHERRAALAEAIRRKNIVSAPLVRPVGLEVRTAIGFTLKTDADSLLADRKGATAFRVVWEYKVRSDRLNSFSFALQGREKELFDSAAKGKIRYLGTYVIKEDPLEIPVFVTSWGCDNEDDARTVARGPWKGPAGAEEAFKELFSPEFFNHGKASITTQALAAAAVLDDDEDDE